MGLNREVFVLRAIAGPCGPVVFRHNSGGFPSVVQTVVILTGSNSYAGGVFLDGERLSVGGVLNADVALASAVNEVAGTARLRYVF